MTLVDLTLQEHHINMLRKLVLRDDIGSLS